MNMKDLVIVRGGGDLATGTICKLYKSGFNVLVLETDAPSAIRRNVAFSEAVYEKTKTVEDVTCVLAPSQQEAIKLLENGQLCMLVDPLGEAISFFTPQVVVDGILAKRNLGTNKGMAPITIALGPGFEAGVDVDAVIETKRGHHLGRVLYEGWAIPNTGVPGMVGGYSKERVLHSPIDGIFHGVVSITDTVYAGQTIGYIDNAGKKVPVVATIDGILRGILREGMYVTSGFKIADIDPRKDEYENCFTISDKARCIAGGVLEAILTIKHKKQI